MAYCASKWKDLNWKNGHGVKMLYIKNTVRYSFTFLLYLFPFYLINLFVIDLFLNSKIFLHS